MKSDIRQKISRADPSSPFETAAVKQPISIPYAEPVAIVVLAGLLVWLYFRLPRMGDIWWADAPRHALNGAFVLDFIRQMPLHHPVAFAYDYYRQWPALSILFYPPLFYVSLALGYALCGVSESSALLVEFVWFFLLVWGSFRLSRYWLGPAGSLAVSLLLIAGPQLFFWGQQIMLDVPAYALMVWAAYSAIAYMKTGCRWALILGVVMAVLAVWTRYDTAIFLAVIAIALLLARGPRVLRERAAIEAAAVGALFLVPVLALFFKFGSYDLHQAVASVQGVRSPLASLFYYATIMPEIVSWPALILAAAYAVLAAMWPRCRLDRDTSIFLIAWIVGTYLFYSAIALKEPRHILTIGYPIVLAAVLAIDRAFGFWRWRGIISLVVAFAALATTIWSIPVPYVTGMRHAAQTVAELAPSETNVAVWCRYDGTFVFAMRANVAAQDLGVVRLDKVLFRDVAVAFERGFTQRKLYAGQIYQELKELHVQYVVFQSGYMDDVEVVRQLEAALSTPSFVEVATIPMSANYGFSYVTTLHVYRLKEEVPRGRISPQMQIELLGGKVL